MNVLEDFELLRISFILFVFFPLLHVFIMIAAVAISSELNFTNDEKNFIEKEPAYITLFDAKFFK